MRDFEDYGRAFTPTTGQRLRDYLSVADADDASSELMGLIEQIDARRSKQNLSSK